MRIEECEGVSASRKHLVFAYYVTGHGFGDATRVVEVVRNLILAGHDVHVVTGAPDFVFASEIQSPRLFIRKVLLDCGAVQADALTVDRLASLEKYSETAVKPRESILATEIEWLNSIKADLVVSDVVPVACRAAADAGIRSVCVTNFRVNVLNVINNHHSLGGIQIKELPEEMCELYNMQTLDVSVCNEVLKLPDNIGKLIKLRYLRVGNEFVKMRGFEGLGCLRELDEFHVSGSGEGSNIGGLKNLNHLEGSLRIKWLGDVQDPDEVKKAELKSKKNLTWLGLEFGSRTERRIIRGDEILEALEPPPNIDWLGIYDCQGIIQVLPSWINKLRVVVLYKWGKIENLPALGKLPFLEELYVGWMESVRKVGREFLGMEVVAADDDDDSDIIWESGKSGNELKMNHSKDFKDGDNGRESNGDGYTRLANDNTGGGSSDASPPKGFAAGENNAIEIFNNPRIHDEFMGVGEYRNLVLPNGKFGLGFRRFSSSDGSFYGFGWIHRLLELQPHHCGQHVALSGIHAGVDRWGVAADIRKIMAEARIRKVPACCLIDCI
ncbi:hypothetical protein OIU77_005421 [Salix suchowensis]|uniref:R13L1/DRL21-like LRR repeat region domain-containing protein n=1 Tax=Salix suchowensis TaxID=1278906 RepID=A0ABQ9API9_9ROSI|nr:hypothetical protein OIU77_005421 [Salix suchowensis]